MKTRLPFLIIVVLCMAALAHAVTYQITLGWTLPTQNEDGTPCNDLASINVYLLGTTNFVAGQNIVTNVPALTPSPAPDTEQTVELTMSTSTWASVSCLDFAGNESALSEPLWIDVDAPSAPIGLRVVVRVEVEVVDP